MEISKPMINGRHALQTAPQREARAEFDRLGKLIQEELDKYLIPEIKLKQVVEYAIKTLLDNPKMKPARIARKTAEFYHLEEKY
jgi:hypothetical protein